MLAGTLAEFSLGDIFQLFALTKKSGALVVVHDAGEGRVYFRGGEIYFATSEARRMPLGARLVGGGLLPAEQLRYLLTEHRDGEAAQIAKALLAGCDMDAGARERMIREQVHDAIVQLLRLSDGRFTFDNATVVDDWPGPGLDSSTLMEEATRRLDEWHSIAAQVPAADAVASVLPNFTDGESITLTAAQWHLLALIDGRRSVRELVDLSGESEFATCRLLADLVTSGLVEVVDAGEAGRSRLAELLAAREALRRLEELSFGAPSESPYGSASSRSSEATVRSESAPSPEAAPSPESAPVDSAPAQPAAVQPTSAQPEGHHVHAGDGPSAEAADESEASAEDAGDQADAVSDGTAGDVDEFSADADAEPVAASAAQPSGEVDRAQMARELASLGFGDPSPLRRPVRTDTRASAEGNGDGAEGADTSQHLGRDKDPNKGLFSRVIDGVKGT